MKAMISHSICVHLKNNSSKISNNAYGKEGNNLAKNSYLGNNLR
jgi:hypothetical protein